ncbi:MAG: hypothetical protein Q8Q12_00470 [bacterium]|nr:hypothetical protein [bacterium]
MKCKMLILVLSLATLLLGCKLSGVPLSGGVQTVVVTPTGELARLPRQPLSIREPDGTETAVTTDENGLAAFPLQGPEFEYLILTGPQAWRGYAQVVVYVIYQWAGSQLQVVEVKQ